jgi:hypothetical protein
MKNSIKKFVLACAAVTAITAVSATAMAADLGDVYDAETNSVAVTLPTGIDAAKEATVLVLKDGVKLTSELESTDILYVNQATGGDFDGDETAGTETLKLLGEEALADGTYTVAIGYYKDGAFSIQEDTFTLGEAPTPAYKLGDVNADDEIDVTDVLWTAQAATGTKDLTETQRLAADVNADDELDVTDVLWIAQAAVGTRSFE